MFLRRGYCMSVINKCINALRLLYSQVKYKSLMHHFGWKSQIIKPMLLSGLNHVSIGKNVLIRDGVRLEVVDPQSDVVIDIGDNVNIEQYVHIVARCLIKIGDNVSITGACSIVDVVHPYEDITNKNKIGNRISQEYKPVYIGDNSFVGYGVHINPGVSIGKNCVIGARSVVTKNIDDYCVAVGNPAKVIKTYNFKTGSWESIQ
jgi:acetyltransferase-like isoleucine patch superfamily enzyme